MGYRREIPWQEWPDSPGKRVLLKILNSPKPDREKLRRESLQIQLELKELWAKEDAEEAARKNDTGNN